MTIITKKINKDTMPKSHPSLEKQVVSLITNFYKLDDNGRVMQVKKTVLVKVNNKDVKLQKRLEIGKTFIE